MPNTLDTTVHYYEKNKGEPDTFIATGDIPAMWLRDSVNQILPYARYINSSEKIKKLFKGLLSRQTHNINTDPYANAFIDTALEKPVKNTWWPAGDKWHPHVWERKYELDSLCSFMQLSVVYFKSTQDISSFNEAWLSAITSITTIMETEQQTMTKENVDVLHHFQAPNGKSYPSLRMRGFGYPGKSCGLIRTLFRPSDDESVFPYLIPANAMAVVHLRELITILDLKKQGELVERIKKIISNIDKGIQSSGIVVHPHYGKIFAYEVDGFGSQYLMDDPNIPSLLSLPYIGYCSIDDEIYQNTRRYILSEANPFYARGIVLSGLTSPHTGIIDHVWPMAVIMQGLTSKDEKEIIQCLSLLRQSHANTYFIHESIHVDDSQKYTRPWFCWANSLFAELILHISETRPHILKQVF